MSGVFIAGTDTGIGKTHAACALLHALRGRGIDAVGMKPVASGCAVTAEGLRNEDALALREAAVDNGPYERTNPIALREPLSPHLAARVDGVQIRLERLEPAWQALRLAHEVVVVEGVGGWRVPLAPGLFASDIAIAWQLPVVLVVGLRLGCLSHALLTAEAILADGCALVGWIGNTIDPQMGALQGNLATLHELLPAPCLGVLPHGTSAAEAARYLEPPAFG